MKIWNGYGSEHSANLVLIGTFVNADKAEEAVQLLQEATDIARADEEAGLISAGKVQTSISNGFLDLFKRTELSLGRGGPEELLYEFNSNREGDKVIITTEESGLNAFLQVFLHYGAKVEVYSRHDHRGPYGRPTF